MFKGVSKDILQAFKQLFQGLLKGIPGPLDSFLKGLLKGILWYVGLLVLWSPGPLVYWSLGPLGPGLGQRLGHGPSKGLLKKGLLKTF